MKRSGLIFAAMLLLSGCSSKGPTGTINSWKAAFDNADFDKTATFYTQSYLTKNGGADKIKQQLKDGYEMEKSEGSRMQFSHMKEHVNGDKADVCWQMTYRGHDSKMLAHLAKENGSWKIDDYGNETEAAECLK